MDQELIMRAQAIEQQAQEIEQNIEVVDQQLNGLVDFRKTLDNFDKSNSGEMLAMLGSGVYAKTEVKDKSLFVNVGANIVIKKSAKETIEVVEEQVKRLREVKMQLNAKKQAYAHAFQELLIELQEAQSSGKAEKS